MAISFGGAATVKRGGSKKSTASLAEIEITGLRDLKACRRLRAVILAVEADVETKAKNQMTKLFIEQGCKTKGRPENFTGIDEGQNANCQLRARNFGPYGIDDDMAETIGNVGLGNMIETEETFSFNQDVLTPAVMKAIEEALGKVKGLPDNLILRTAKRSLNADAIATVFRTKDAAFLESALPLLSSLAIRCDYDKTDENIAPDVARVSKLLGEPEFADIVKTAANDPDSALNPPRKSKPKKKAA